jgi:hypothetical protein
MNMKLKVSAGDHETLLLRLVGVGAPVGAKGLSPLLMGSADELDDPEIAGVVLPDPEAPEAETERLARLLARAVGLGQLKL